MTKEELKKYLEGLKLEEDLKTLLFGLIDKAEKVDAAFLNTIADILDLQADFHEKCADVLEEEAGLYQTLADELSALVKEENTPLPAPVE